MTANRARCSFRSTRRTAGNHPERLLSPGTKRWGFHHQHRYGPDSQGRSRHIADYRAMNKIGADRTGEEFNGAIGRACVPTRTGARDKFDNGFERVRDAVFNGEGLGRASSLTSCSVLHASRHNPRDRRVALRRGEGAGRRVTDRPSLAPLDGPCPATEAVVEDGGAVGVGRRATSVSAHLVVEGRVAVLSVTDRPVLRPIES